MKYRPLLTGLATTAFLAVPAFHGSGQAADFYAGKKVNLYIGYNVGSAYDKYARLLAENIDRFLPGKPAIIPRNMPGASGMRVMNFIYQTAPKDGTAWGAIDRGIAAEPLLYGKRSKAAFKDPLEFNWIGSLNTETGVAAVWHTTGVKTWEEARTKRIIVAISSSRGGVSSRVVNSLLESDFQQVCCYGGG
jgi:tripartite-type tricarboxylate transporter receptor subunit TctC